jgi:hypothetical protein
MGVFALLRATPTFAVPSDTQTRRWGLGTRDGGTSLVFVGATEEALVQQRQQRQQQQQQQQQPQLNALVVENMPAQDERDALRCPVEVFPTIKMSLGGCAASSLLPVSRMTHPQDEASLFTSNLQSISVHGQLLYQQKGLFGSSRVLRCKSLRRPFGPIPKHAQRVFPSSCVAPDRVYIVNKEEHSVSFIVAKSALGRDIISVHRRAKESFSLLAQGGSAH